MVYRKSKTKGETPNDPAHNRYRAKRIGHWDQVSRLKENPGRPGAFYHKLLLHYYKHVIPHGLRILEIGCGHGDLLSSLKPSLGVGIDFSGEMVRYASVRHPDLTFIQADVHEIEFNQKFDAIILSDLVNDLWDVQRVLEKLRKVTHSGTRLVLNFYNNLWRIPLTLVKWLGLGAEVLEQNWFSPHDVYNLLKLSGFEVVNRRSIVLLPINVPFLSTLLNRYLVHLPPFSWFALSNIVIARPDPARDKRNLRDAPSVSVIVPARNEAGNIEDILTRVPELGSQTELIFVEGQSNDSTYDTIKQLIAKFDEKVQTVSTDRYRKRRCGANGI